MDGGAAEVGLGPVVLRVGDGVVGRGVEDGLEAAASVRLLRSAARDARRGAVLREAVPVAAVVGVVDDVLVLLSEVDVAAALEPPAEDEPEGALGVVRAT